MTPNDIAARKGVGPIAVKTFFQIAKRWKLTRAEAMALLGLTATSTYANWKNGQAPNVPVDTIERISYVIEVDKILSEAFKGIDAYVREWLTSDNHESPFDSMSPLAFMTQGRVIFVYKSKCYLATKALSSLQHDIDAVFADEPSAVNQAAGQYQSNLNAHAQPSPAAQTFSPYVSPYGGNNFSQNAS